MHPRVRQGLAFLVTVAFAGLTAMTGLFPIGLGLVIPLYARLARDGLLEDGTRPKIMELLRSEPGLGITDICERLAIGWGTAVHHLTRLEDAGLVVSQDSGRRRRFFLPSESPTRRTALCVLSSDLNRRLLQLVQASPGRTQQEVCAALGISAPLAHKYLARLIRDHFVSTVRQWRTVRYYPSETVPAVLDAYAEAVGAGGGQGLPRPADLESPSPDRGPPPG
jgi:DNA-binding transcriptional ArsR family regulator